jgi:hypothetical protein
MPRGLIRAKDIIFAPNWQLGEELRRSGVLDAALLAITSEIALTAREIAVKEAFDTGEYLGSIHGGLARSKRGLPLGRVQADDFKGGWIEKGHRTPGGGFVKGRNILRRAGRRSGLRVRAPRRRPNSTG